VQRAAQVNPAFRADRENIEEIAEICSRLEGIPLALELAAARTKVLPLAEIARRLDDRFRLLKGTSRTALPHHQTLEALIGWSYEHLPENEKRLFRRLSPFRGGWTLEAAESICAGDDLESWEVLDILTRLIEKSLVVFSAGTGAEGEAVREPGDPATPAVATPASAPASGPRYRMLETVREYAQARFHEAGESEPVLARFQSYFIRLVVSAGPFLMGPAQGEWMARLDAELDNLRATITRACEAADPAPALQITGQMLRYWLIRASFREGQAALERAIEMPGAEAPTVLLGVALNSLGSCAFQLNDLDTATRHYRRAVEVFAGTAEPARAHAPLINLGNVYRVRGDFDAAVASFEESLQHIDASNHWMIAAVQGNLGSIALTRENYDEARTRIQAAIDLQRQIGDGVHLGMSRMNLGLVALRQERFAEARALFEENAVFFEEIGDRNFGASNLVNLGIVLLAMGAGAEAPAVFAKALRIVRDTGSMENVAACLEGLSEIARPRGDVARAARLAGAAQAIRTKFEIPRHPADQRQWETENGAYASRVGEEAFARHFAEGEALDWQAAVELGLESALDPADIR
jgi:non-specific serine/threonine protein kinase